MVDEKVTAIRQGVEVDHSLAARIQADLADYAAEYGEMPNGYVLVLIQDDERTTRTRPTIQSPPSLTSRACEGLAVSALIRNMK